MKTSLDTNAIATALAKAQSVMRNPEKNRTAVIPTKDGRKYTFSYADLPSTYDTNRKVLAENGLSHSFGTKCESDKTIAVCRLEHASGQWYESELELPKSMDIKGLAGNLTYLRRYLYNGLVGVAGDDDVDGEPEAAEAKYPHKEKQPVKMAPVPVKAVLSREEMEKAIRTHMQMINWEAVDLKDYCHEAFGKLPLALTLDELKKTMEHLATL